MVSSGSLLPIPEVPIVDSGSLVLTSSGSSASSASASGFLVSGLLVSSGAVVSSFPIPIPDPIPLPIRIILTEVSWAGSDLSTADEWVELGAFGSGSATLPRSMSGWTLLSVKAGVETLIARLPDRLLADGEAIVIANTSAATSRLALEPGVVTTALSLSNTQLLLRLRDASGALIDEVDDGVGVPFAGANPSGGGPKASMERVDPFVSGTLKENWKTATESLGFDDGPPIFGTPGFLASAELASEAGSSSSASAQSAAADGAGSSSSLFVPVPSPQIRLTEILANPPGVDSDEWLEIGSFDAVEIDLSEITLRVGTVRFALSGTLPPGGHRRFGKLQTGLPLANAGGTVELLWRDKIIDTWTYVETAEGVSAGRLGDGTVQALCVPSPDMPNIALPLDAEIHVQSANPGSSTLSLNLEARALLGSMAGAVCTWSYPDGFASNSCNPPSRTLKGPLNGDVRLILLDYCGNTVLHLLHVDVAGKSGSLEERTSSFACTPSAFTGVVISEFLPNPSGDETAGEWIELENPTTEEKPLCGWSLDDDERGSEAFSLDAWRLPPGERLTFLRSETDIGLNNDRDAVRLFSPLPQGGSGAYRIVRYEASPEDRSFARRTDGHWLWTDPTPLTENIFPDPQWPYRVLARIVQALPNPGGRDSDGGEWIEVRNETHFPLPLTGWSLKTAANILRLDGILKPSERKRILLTSETLTLTNTNGTVRLFDRDDVPVSLLAWGTAKDGEAVRSPTLSPMSDCHISGLIIDDENKCMNFISALIKDKKIDQEMYSNFDLAATLLRSGIATVDEDAPSELSVFFRAYEQEARAARLGFWSNSEQVELLDIGRETADLRRILEHDGLQLKLSHRSGVIAAGEFLEIETNVPALLSIAVGTGAYAPYTGPLMVQRDLDLHVRATVDDVTATGSYAFALMRDRYEPLRISEVYPSPQKGEAEWVELFNPTASAVRLAGWMLDDVRDAGSKPAALPGNIFLAPGERLRLQDLSIAWNNGGDSARLIAPNGKVMHAVDYGSVKKGLAIAMFFGERGNQKGQCATAHPTPEGQNRCAEELPKAKKATAKKKAAARVAKRKVKYRNLVAETAVAAETGSVLFERLRGQGEEEARSINVLWLGMAFPVLFACCTGLACGAIVVLRKRR